MTTINKGVSSSETANTEGRRIIDMDDMVHLVDGNKAPLVKLLTSPGIKKAVAHSPKVEWLTSTILPKFDVFTEGLDNSETAVDVAHGDYFRLGDVILNVFTLERMFVTGISSNTLTVTRGWGGTAATASVGNADQIYRLGNAAAEGATLGNIRQVATVENYNYTQIGSNAGGFTGTEVATDLYGGPEPKQEMKKKLLEHAIDWESNFFFGTRNASTDAVSGLPVRTMGGLVEYIDTHVTEGVGTLTEAIWDAWLDTAARNVDGELTIFMGTKVNAKVMTFARNRIAINSDGGDLKSFGVQLLNYRNSSGNDFKLIVKKDWADWTATASTYSPSGLAVAVDLSNLQIATMKGRDTKMLGDQQANDEDAVKFQIRTEQSLRIFNEQNHAVMAGVTG